MDKHDSIQLIRELKKIPGALSYDGDVSTQVLLPTVEGKYLRVGITDADIDTGKLWFDYYEGLKIK